MVFLSFLTVENTSASLSESIYRVFLEPEEVKPLSFAAGRFGAVFQAGQAAENVYFLKSGLVKLYKYKSSEESKAATVDLASEGELFGEEALAEGARYGFSAEALPIGASIYLIPRAVFLQTCEAHPGLWRAIAESTLLKTQRLQRRVSSLGLKLCNLIACSDSVIYRTDGYMKCPRCLRWTAVRSRLHGIVDRMRVIFFRLPFRCTSCGKRYYKTVLPWKHPFKDHSVSSASRRHE